MKNQSKKENKSSMGDAGSFKGIDRQHASELDSSARSKMASNTTKGQARRADTGRTLGSATKDARHGVNTDRATSRRTESRRGFSMGSESKSKSHRKNV